MLIHNSIHLLRTKLKVLKFPTNMYLLKSCPTCEKNSLLLLKLLQTLEILERKGLWLPLVKRTKVSIWCQSWGSKLIVELMKCIASSRYTCYLLHLCEHCFWKMRSIPFINFQPLSLQFFRLEEGCGWTRVRRR